MADVEFAVQVIGFVQEGAGQQIFAGFLEPFPLTSWARMVTLRARVTGSRNSGMLRQPSFCVWRPSV